MSILYRYENYIFINHKEFIKKMYENVSGSLQDPQVAEKQSFTITGRLFSIINNKEKYSERRKRTCESDNVLEEASKVKQMYHEFLQNLPLKTKEDLNSCNFFDTSDVRDLAKKYFESTTFDHNGLSGGNNSDVALKCKVKDDYFLFPKYSKFFCGCVKEKCKKLSGNKYDIVIADPPWWNKYIRRLKQANGKLGYSMMYNEDIASIAVKELLSNNCIVAVWCTNAPSNISAVKHIIFPAWGVEYITTWYWLKVTVDLEPICEFGAGCKKQPYERIILGSVGNVSVPKDCLVTSIPSALHSHKPPLLDLLSPCVNKENPQILELFARYLLPNTTSVGYEPLKWQHISLYEET